MPKRPAKKPPSDDPNKAAKALVDRVATLTEDGDDKAPPADPQDDTEDR